MLWTIADSKKLSKKAKEVITDPDNVITVSAVSFWEVSLKSSLGKLEITGFKPENLPDACWEMGFEILTLSPEDSSSYYKLKSVYHKDPFDRMLIWQAIQHNYSLISIDSNVKKYISDGLKIWDVK
jgi:PIN domain nuclease of toxin-antitoxin system